MRTPWTQQEIDIVRARYADELTRDIAADLGRSTKSVFSRAKNLGLSKSKAYLASPPACRFQREQTATQKANRFRQNQTPWNKGQSFHAGGNSIQTQFQKGQMAGAAQRKYVPIGSTRINYGNLERKITDDPNIYPAARWRPVHRLLWEAEHGNVPSGYIVVFRPGRHTTVESDITLDRLECISRAENMRRNTVHRYPKEVAQVMQLRGVLNRKINNRSQVNEKSN